MTGPTTLGIIDSHLHLWRLGPGYPWLTPELGPIYADATAEQAITAMDRGLPLTTAPHGGGLGRPRVDGAILVQAADTPADTDAMLEVARASPRFVGVVGWVPLDDPDACSATLAKMTSERLIVGVRHLIHDDPRPRFLELPEVRESLALVGEHGLAVDLPDAFPGFLDQAADLAASLPELVVVIDHLAKPPAPGGPDFDLWAAQLRDAASLPNTVAKVSGLQRPQEALDADALAPVLDLAVELFGPHRLMFGSDWPMTRGSGGYEASSRVAAAVAERLDGPGRAAFLGGTARRVYRLDERCEPGRGG